jgi:hypothetical protein
LQLVGQLQTLQLLLLLLPLPLALHSTCMAFYN